jgi:hypothetical protein
MAPMKDAILAALAVTSGITHNNYDATTTSSHDSLCQAPKLVIDSTTTMATNYPDSTPCVAYIQHRGTNYGPFAFQIPTSNTCQDGYNYCASCTSLSGNWQCIEGLWTLTEYSGTYSYGCYADGCSPSPSTAFAPFTSTLACKTHCTSKPTHQPTHRPTRPPSRRPSHKPSRRPSRRPTRAPTGVTGIVKDFPIPYNRKYISIPATIFDNLPAQVVDIELTFDGVVLAALVVTNDGSVGSPVGAKLMGWDINTLQPLPFKKGIVRSGARTMAIAAMQGSTLVGVYEYGEPNSVFQIYDYRTDEITFSTAVPSGGCIISAAPGYFLLRLSFIQGEIMNIYSSTGQVILNEFLPPSPCLSFGVPVIDVIWSFNGTALVPTEPVVWIPCEPDTTGILYPLRPGTPMTTLGPTPAGVWWGSFTGAPLFSDGYFTMGGGEEYWNGDWENTDFLHLNTTVYSRFFGQTTYNPVNDVDRYLSVPQGPGKVSVSKSGAFVFISYFYSNNSYIYMPFNNRAYRVDAAQRAVKGSWNIFNMDRQGNFTEGLVILSGVGNGWFTSKSTLEIFTFPGIPPCGSIDESSCVTLPKCLWSDELGTCYSAILGLPPAPPLPKITIFSAGLFSLVGSNGFSKARDACSNAATYSMQCSCVKPILNGYSNGKAILISSLFWNNACPNVVGGIDQGTVQSPIGITLADTWSSIAFGGGLKVSLSGAGVLPANSNFWTGSQEPNQINSMTDQNCKQSGGTDSWTSHSNSAFGSIGSSDSTINWWDSSQKATCDTKQHLLCACVT